MDRVVQLLSHRPRQLDRKIGVAALQIEIDCEVIIPSQSLQIGV